MPVLPVSECTDFIVFEDGREVDVYRLLVAVENDEDGRGGLTAEDKAEIRQILEAIVYYKGWRIMDWQKVSGGAVGYLHRCQETLRLNGIRDDDETMARAFLGNEVYENMQKAALRVQAERAVNEGGVKE